MIFLHVSGQLLPCNGQPDLLSHLRDHSATFAGFGDDFNTLGMILRYCRALYDDWKTLGQSVFLKIITTVRAYIKLLEPTPVTMDQNWVKVRPNLGQIWTILGSVTAV